MVLGTRDHAPESRLRRDHPLAEGEAAVEPPLAGLDHREGALRPLVEGVALDADHRPGPALGRVDLGRPSRSSGSFEGSQITGIESFAFAPASDTTDLEFRGAGAGERVVFGNSFLAGASARLALGGGDDEGVGGVGDDTILGGGGRDILDGGGGDDRLDGGKGPDRFRFQQGFGEDTIAGFRPDSDRLDFSLHFGVVGMGDLSMSRRGSDTLIEVGLGDSILLLDVAPREIDRGDLIFA